MAEDQKALAIIGSYRQGGTIDSVVGEIMTSLEESGLKTETIYLREQHIEFCANCRACLQKQGSVRGKCPLDDDMDAILAAIETADCLVLGAPVNFGNINALTRAFMERCICFAYWPWDTPAPKIRKHRPTKKALLISASAAPAWLGRHFSGAPAALKKLSRMIGARPVGILWVGLVNRKNPSLSGITRRRARKLARKLVL
ncbi:flavodoxin family protein [Geothermobacter hydrogeniphilus]|uniref:NAD(P)H dehydrogenase n=1 Tax=Geothermobacter hydrogeniphilus TaxID=1969733 RepID=A0A1X0YDB3_9BACT|nr:flavodoxin family protein [Geothermobacter hydrogeniphilus]ORJ63127.1 NAD(P)H dehydrogenase [Geothermobacter hydrogeniphilus]